MRERAMVDDQRDERRRSTSAISSTRADADLHARLLDPAASAEPCAVPLATCGRAPAAARRCCP